MNKNEFIVLRHYLNKGHITNVRETSKELSLSLGTISKMNNELLSKGYIDKGNVTKKGIDALKPYKVDNAIIMAAGMSRRLAPLSFDKPKGLFDIKGEILIERQIKQLQEAGIKDISIVIGYKKESFFYLGEKYNVNIRINPYFETKNNVETLYICKDILKRTYICSCDQYFLTNPFNQYEYDTFYTCVKDKNNNDEPKVILGSNDKIISFDKGNKSDIVLLGFAFFNKDFSDAFIKLISSHRDSGDFDNDFWENAYKKHMQELPPMYMSLRDEKSIFEFDNLKQLREFDNKYIENTESKIMKTIARVLDCKEGDILDFKPIQEGLTNTSYTFIVHGNKYVYRHPGEGTKEFIDRHNEKNALKIAKEANIDPSYIRMSAHEGWKISHFVENTHFPDYFDLEDTKIVIKKMKELHDSNHVVDFEFNPWKDSLKLERKLKKLQSIDMPDFLDLKKDIQTLFLKVDKDGLYTKRLCHCDTYRPNWLIKNDMSDVILIDWEYAGNADPGVDVGYYIVDAMYDVDKAKEIIKMYLGDSYDYEHEKHFMAYTAIIAYYWFVWALYKQAIGSVIGDVIYNWYYMAKKYSKYVLRNYYND